MEAFYQVPRRTISTAAEYDMASDGRTEDLQENAYEHMQTLRHIHVSSPPEAKSTPRRLEMISNRKVQAAILITTILSLSLAVIAMIFTAQANNGTNDKSTQLVHEDLWREISNAESDLLSTIQELNNTIAENERKLGNLKALLDGVIGSSLRLAGGSESDGRVEIMYDGNWGTICDDDWDLQDAHVICRMYGFDKAIAAPTNATYGEGSGPIWLTNVACKGDEATIWECDKSKWSRSHRCGHDEDASVKCV